MYSSKIKTRFCKDNGIPIALTESPYFEERLKLYDPLFDCLKKWELFQKELELYGSEQDYFEYYNSVKDTAINGIKSAPAFQEFNNRDMNCFKSNEFNLNSKTIYKDSNSNLTFLSIDLKKANYQALKQYDASIVNNSKNYQEFISGYTKMQHIIDSKYIRQVIFGSCNPGRQTTYEKWLLLPIVKNLIASGCNIVLYSCDEVVISIDSTAMEKFPWIPDCHDDNLTPKAREDLDAPNLEFHTTAFKLVHIPNTEIYLRYGLDNKIIDVKGANPVTYPFVLRQLSNQEPVDSDLVFKSEYGTAKLLTVPTILIP